MKDKLPLVKDSLHFVVQQLRNEDKNNLALEINESNELIRVHNAILLKKEKSNKITVEAFGRDATKKFTLTRKDQYSDYICFGRIKILMRKKVTILNN